MFRPWSAALFAALLLSAACDDAAAPEGESGSIVVTAYVDLDASGTPTEGDVFLQNFELALQQDGATVATETTGADGTATFEDIAPGSYRIVPVSQAPAGAALATSPSPSAVVSFQGTAPEVEFRYVWYPGTISGWVYRNDGGTPQYEEGTDTPGSGVTVYLREDAGGTPGDTLTWTTVGANAGYRFTGLAPGTYWVEFERLGAMSYEEGERLFQVTVAPQSAVEQSARFTGSIFMTIAEARAMPVDSTVAVVGTITVPAGVFTSSNDRSEIWVQDATGGIAVFPVPTSSAADYPLHRVLEVVGTRAVFNGKEQISNPTTRSRGAGTAVAPVTLTGTEVNSLADEGELVRLANTRVDSLSSGTTSFSVFTTAPDGQVVIVRVASGTGFARDDFTPLTRYDVTGVLTEFRGTPQIQPRFDTDLVEVSAPLTIAAARMLDTGTVVRVIGNVTVPPNVFTSGSGGANSEVWIQDATGGIATFPVASSLAGTYVLGDRLEVNGTLKIFNGQLQIGTIGFEPVVTEVAGAQIVAPTVITAAQANSLADEGELVTVGGLTVTAVGTGTGGFNVTTVSAANDTLTIRIHNQTTVGLTPASFTVGSTYSFTGILTQFRGTAQIKPRSAADVVQQ